MHSCREFINWHCNHKHEPGKFSTSQKECGVMHFHKIFQHLLWRYIASLHSTFLGGIRTLTFSKNFTQQKYFEMILWKKWNYFENSHCAQRLWVWWREGEVHTSPTISEQSRYGTCDLGMITSPASLTFDIKYWRSNHSLNTKNILNGSTSACTRFIHWLAIKIQKFLVHPIQFPWQINHNQLLCEKCGL